MPQYKMGYIENNLAILHQEYDAQTMSRELWQLCYE